MPFIRSRSFTGTKVKLRAKGEMGVSRGIPPPKEDVDNLGHGLLPFGAF